MIEFMSIKEPVIGHDHDHDREASANLSAAKAHAHDHGDGNRWLMVIETIVCLVAGLFGLSCELLAGDGSVSSPWIVSSRVAYLVSYVAGGRFTLIHAWQDLRGGRVNIDLLMIAAAVGSAAIGHWSDGAALLFLFSLSHTMETLILGRTRRAIADLMDLAPEEALVVRKDGEIRVAVADLKPDDIVVVRPAERIPADGIVCSGQTSVDQSPLTGESIPVDKVPGDTVFSGTLNQQGVIHVAVTRTAGESTLSRMVRLVEEAQSQRAESQRFTEWFGENYAWAVLALSIATLLISIGIFQLSWSAAIYKAMTVLVVASPCAVVISIPAAILAAITSAAKGGVLFKGGAAMEKTAALKAIAFDKTGTLTIGKPSVVSVIPADGHTEEQLLQAAAALEEHSEHPLARAVVQAAKDRGLIWNDAHAVEAVTGYGLKGACAGVNLRIGKLTWFDPSVSWTDAATTESVNAAQSRGETVVALAGDSRWWGALGIADVLRPTAKACVSELRRLGVTQLTMLTGDSELVARNLAAQVGLSYRAGLLPQDKLEAIKGLRQQYGPTGMIGDGMNDAPSLAAADVGFSLGGAGTDVALETADVVILADDLRRLPYAIGLARATQHIIQQNLLIAFGVMASLLVVSLVTTLPLPLAVLGHEGSTVVVILNGLRLLRFPRPESLPNSS